MKTKLLAFGVSLLAMATIGVVQLQSKAVDSSRDCDQYAVIRCGTLSRDELIKEFESNNTAAANGATAEQADIKKVFNAMGITRADLDRRVEQGVVYRDGTIKVGDKVVATDAMMAARGLGGTQIAGTQAQKVSVNAMSDAQTAMVFYKDGKFAFAVMKPCGNPVSAKPKETPEPQPTPVAKCVGVTATMQERNKYLLTATAEVSGGATIKSYTFVTTSDGKTIFDNTYKTAATTQNVVYQNLAPGTYKVKVTVDTSEGVKRGQDCVTTFTVAPPVTTTELKPGVTIEKFVNNDQKAAKVSENVEYSYRLVVRNTGNTDLENVLVTDTADEGITLVSVSPPNGTITAPTGTNTKYVFTYTIPKLVVGESRTFTLNAKVPTYRAGMLKNTVCVDAPAVPGTPDKCDSATVEVPPKGKVLVCDVASKNIIEVEDGQQGNYKPVDSEDCKEVEITPVSTPTPTELPKTGPAETALSIIGAMSLVGSSAYYLMSRRNS